MLHFIKRQVARFKQKKYGVTEYGTTIHAYPIEGFGEVKFAQWMHPSEKQVILSKSHVDFYKQLARQGGTIVDIGTHTGDTTVPMALSVGKEGLVIGLEPNRYVFKILEENAALNKELTNIEVYCFAATKDDGEFVFNYSDASFCNGGFLTEIENQKHNHNYELEVIGKNLQNFLFEKYADRLDKLDLIKIDAEGYDKEILKTLPEILKTYKPNLMIECYKKLTSEERAELFDVVDHAGYQLFYLENFEDNGKKVAISKEQMNDQKHFEMLAIHQDRLQDFLARI
jgi:FkbM family methyltransferase